MNPNDLTINAISHTANGYKVTYTIYAQNSKSKVTMPIPYTSLPQQEGNVENSIREYLVKNMMENN